MLSEIHIHVYNAGILNAVQESFVSSNGGGSSSAQANSESHGIWSFGELPVGCSHKREILLRFVYFGHQYCCVSLLLQDLSCFCETLTLFNNEWQMLIEIHIVPYHKAIYRSSLSRWEQNLSSVLTFFVLLHQTMCNRIFAH